MQSLMIETPIPFLLPADRPIQAILVGCGGTGSHIAQSLARIAAHVQQAGLPSLQLVFVDGDTIEAKNVGRQLFSPAEVGRNKAQSLAQRFSVALGQRISAIPEMLSHTILGDLRRRDAITILIGAVDTAEARQLLHDGLEYGAAQLWLDCGNEESAGQVCVGSSVDSTAIRQAFTIAGLCSALPAPSLQYPDLLKAVPKKVEREDCAARQEDNIQSLMVNQMMAAIAAEYLYNLIVRRRLATFATIVDLTTLTMRSQPITCQAIGAICPCVPTKSAARSKKRAA